MISEKEKMMTAWTEKRLQYLFSHYNQRFWRGRLLHVHIRIRNLTNDGGPVFGRIEWKQREILINIDAHTTDRAIRATLLHEMAHLATPRKERHDSEFWAQIERLLRQRAPLTVSSCETPGLGIFHDVVPARFRLARRALNRVEKKRRLDVEKFACESALPTRTITDADIATQFYEAGAEVTWRVALGIIGLEMGLLDVDGKPKSRWAARVVAMGRRAHARGRRDHFAYEKSQREFEARFGASIVQGGN